MGQCNSNCLVHAQPSPTEKATMGQGCSSIAVHMRPPAADAISQSPPTKDEENQSNKNQEVQVSVCLDNASEHSINIRINFNMDDSLHSSHSQHKDILFTVNTSNHTAGTQQISTVTKSCRGQAHSKPVFPKNHHRKHSEQIESRRSAHRRSPSNSSDVPPLLLQRDDSIKSTNSWLNLSVHGGKPKKHSRKNSQDSTLTFSSWGALTIPTSKELEGASLLPPLDASMNDLSGNTLPSRFDYSGSSRLDYSGSSRLDYSGSERSESHRLKVRRLTEDKPKSLPPNPPRSLSSVQLRKQKVQQMIDKVIDQYGQSSQNLPRSDYLGLRREPWNPQRLSAAF